MAKTQSARLEARIPTKIYDQVKQAAQLQGMTLTGYLIATLGDNARRTIEEAQIVKLAQEDQIRFAEALLAPAPPPNDALIQAAELYKKLVQPNDK